MLSVNPDRAASSSGSDTISDDEMSLLVLTATTHTHFAFTTLITQRTQSVS